MKGITEIPTARSYIFSSLTNSDEKTLEPYGTLPNMSPELIPPNEERPLGILQKTKINKHNGIDTALQSKREEPDLPHNETPFFSIIIYTRN